MPLFTTDNMPEHTPVPNAFIHTHMLDAPPSFVKVYLMARYFLLREQTDTPGDFNGLCRALCMTGEEVVAAFEYWQQKGLLRIVNGKDFHIRFLSAAETSESSLYTEQAYNVTLQKLFGARVLTPAEYTRIYDFTDVFKLPREVALLLVEYCVKKKGKNVSLAYMEKVAKSWAEEGVDSVDAAVVRIKRFDAGASGAGQVLRHMGVMDRLPTEDEMALYEKWTRDWGFALDAVKLACAQTTKSRNPSMKYLDAILKSLYEKGLTTSSRIHAAHSREEGDAAAVKRILLALGAGGFSVTPEHIAFYRKWTGVFPLDVILHAAGQAARYSKKPFPYMEKVLQNWQEAGYRTLPEIEKRKQADAALDRELKTLFQCAGIQKTVLEADRKKYRKWTQEWGFPKNVLSLACEISSVSDKPYQYLEKLLQAWCEKGVKTPEQASAEARKAPRPAADARKNNAESLKYMQRSYTDADLSSRFVDLKNDAEG